MLTLLTCTGARPDAWALCQRWMARQTFTGEVHWIVVDDGPLPQAWSVVLPDSWSTDVVRPQPLWQPGQNTQARNLLAGLERVEEGARLVIVEDDDWYAPDWLEFVDSALSGHLLVGESHARYYNVATRTARQLRNDSHASLCATACSGNAVDALRIAAARNEKFIDLSLWRNHRHKRLLASHRVVGIKGLPGRAGIGMGHRQDMQGLADPKGAVLAQWLGELDAKEYLR